jgi:BCD family chlorophyll transporter-like MFS transporter
MAFVRFVIKTIRLSIVRIGAGWMFALLTFNFNRVSISDLGAIAVIVTSLIGLHHFISFFSVYWGRFSDRTPILGYRRTPYVLLSSLVASLIFLLLPSIAIGLGAHSALATIEAIVLIVIFGISMSMNGSSSNALIAEVTTPKERGAVVAVVWAAIIISGIGSAIVAGAIMPSYDPAKMQQLYNLTPWVVMITALVGVLGLERRIGKEEQAALLAAMPDHEGDSPLSTFRVAANLMRGNVQVRAFFLYMLLAIMGVFLQDAILEPFGAEVFKMNQAATAHFQQAWGVGALLGMFGIGILSSLLPISKKTIATIGGLGIAGGLALVAVSSVISRQSLIEPGLMLMGLGIGLFNVGSLSMMMEMTVEGQTGLYMGLWAMAQGLGNGLANVVSGALHTVLIESHLLSAPAAYTAIFSFEALVMVSAVGILRGISVQEFKGLSTKDIGAVLAMDTAG